MGNALNGHPVLKALRQELSAMASVVPFEAMGELRAVIFSVMFWSNQDPDVSARNAAVPGAFQPDERGMVKMPKSPNEILKRPNENMTGFYTNFDFAWWDETRNVWWDADRTALPTPEMPAQKMTIYEKDLQTLKQLPADFDRQVFSVALARRPTTTKK